MRRVINALSKPIGTLVCVVTIGMLSGRILLRMDAADAIDAEQVLSTIPIAVKLFLFMMLTSGGFLLPLGSVEPERSASPNRFGIAPIGSFASTATAVFLPILLLLILAGVIRVIAGSVVAIGMMILALSPIANSSIGWAFVTENDSRLLKLAMRLLLLSWAIPVIAFGLIFNFGQPSEAIVSVMEFSFLSLMAFAVGVFLRVATRTAKRTATWAHSFGLIGLLGLNFCAGVHLGFQRDLMSHWPNVAMGITAPLLCWIVASAIFSDRDAGDRRVLIRAATMKNTGLTTAAAMNMQAASESLPDAVAMMLVATIVQHVLAAHSHQRWTTTSQSGSRMSPR
ncbi:hypothetical protein [Rhodopirellula sp. SWK7]|uniref:hypothetical protein n=1 Tax=Rhodopirellula sp. SWK7 TaxID=595460 RepID=UPI001181BE62|nr:hypothetical protein [Rhodopirellula sp. SWK7]